MRERANERGRVVVALRLSPPPRALQATMYALPVHRPDGLRGHCRPRHRRPKCIACVVVPLAIARWSSATSQKAVASGVPVLLSRLDGVCAVIYACVCVCVCVCVCRWDRYHCECLRLLPADVEALPVFRCFVRPDSVVMLAAGTRPYAP